jgi:hypothetical protein
VFLKRVILKRENNTYKRTFRNFLEILMDLSAQDVQGYVPLTSMSRLRVVKVKEVRISQDLKIPHNIQG